MYRQSAKFYTEYYISDYTVIFTKYMSDVSSDNKYKYHIYIILQTYLKQFKTPWDTCRGNSHWAYK